MPLPRRWQPPHSERGLLHFGSALLPVLQVQLPPLMDEGTCHWLGHTVPAHQGESRAWEFDREEEGFESLLCHFLGPAQVAGSVAEMCRQIEGGAGLGPVPRTHWFPSLACPLCPWGLRVDPVSWSRTTVLRWGGLLTEGETEARGKEGRGSPGTWQQAVVSCS